MANNRIYLRCRGCGQTFFLGKALQEAYATADIYYEDNSMIDGLNRFYRKHSFCEEEKEQHPLYDTELFPMPEGCEGCAGAFDIVYENDEGNGY